jgi:hypothetical protein
LCSNVAKKRMLQQRAGSVSVFLMAYHQTHLHFIPNLVVTVYTTLFLRIVYTTLV